MSLILSGGLFYGLDFHKQNGSRVPRQEGFRGKNGVAGWLVDSCVLMSKHTRSRWDSVQG